MKFGFIFEAGSKVGDNFITKSEAGETIEYVMGVEETSQGLMAIETLAKKGVDKFNFCGAFTKEEIEEWNKATLNRYTLKAMSYPEDQEQLLDTLESFKEYGVIIVNGDLEATEKRELICQECNCRIHFVKNMEDALVAAKELVDGGIYFIELCSWFDEEKLEEIVSAISGKVPVGAAY